MSPTANSSPFDFSDFGGRTSTAAPARANQSGSSVPSGGFDPFAGQPPVVHPAAGFDDAFGGSAGHMSTGSLAVGGPPLLLFAGAFAVAVTGVVLAVLSVADSAVLLAFWGWLLAGPVAIGALAVFSSVDTRRRISSVYSTPSSVHTAYWVVVATCAAGIGAGAWQIALWAGGL
jgi:hypothetical protein